MKDTLRKLLIDSAAIGAVILDGDCTTSTGTDALDSSAPAALLNCGIAEQNMVGVAAGLAIEGVLPLVHGFSAMLLFRAAEQIIHAVAYPNANVKLFGHYSGFSAGVEGAAHHCLNDIAFVNSLPNFRIYTPSDSWSLRAVFAEVIESDGPAYVRMYKGNDDFQYPGDAVRTADAIAIGSDDAEVVVLCYGIVVKEVIEAVRMVGAALSIRIVSLLRLKPLSSENIRMHVGSAAHVVVVEEHCNHGGLGARVGAELFGRRTSVRTIDTLHTGDRFYSSGSIDELRSEAEISAAHIATHLRRLIHERH